MLRILQVALTQRRSFYYNVWIAIASERWAAALSSSDRFPESAQKSDLHPLKICC